ncbi:hypothetical protein GO621_09485 [Mucilaginibacter sp. HMF7410]|uniref:Uncharacterized protein n=1 Tax=Mucilaginibacter arboris TaxID=2682090 RepID=A0A7K1SWZ5_9SPHI|nr:hypothetical protein [Mucilaginibacter arboris]MVN21768.1 hypothetical protein [Mucilaginibacter arboris]
MKANHNYGQHIFYFVYVGLNISNSKNESKSQQVAFYLVLISVGLNISNSKNESKSQRVLERAVLVHCWVKYQ